MHTLITVYGAFGDLALINTMLSRMSNHVRLFCLTFPVKPGFIVFIYFSPLCFPLNTLKSLSLHLCSSASLSLSLPHYRPSLFAQMLLFTTAKENDAEVIFFICFHFQFYCNSSKDLQPLTERVYCLVHGRFFVPCGVENSTKSQQSEKYYSRRL